MGQEDLETDDRCFRIINFMNSSGGYVHRWFSQGEWIFSVFKNIVLHLTLITNSPGSTFNLVIIHTSSHFIICFMTFTLFDHHSFSL